VDARLHDHLLPDREWDCRSALPLRPDADLRWIDYLRLSSVKSTADLSSEHLPRAPPDGFHSATPFDVPAAPLLAIVGAVGT
jgi:hypothetical protein